MADDVTAAAPRFAIGSCVLLFFLAAPAAPAQLPLHHKPQRTEPAITPADLETRLYIFADDSMLGRGAWTEGSVRATNYVAQEARRLGLVPAGEGGGYFQSVPQPSRAADPRLPPLPSSSSWPARNVIAVLPGSDPRLSGEYVALGAHSDHFPFRHPAADHDSLRVWNTLVWVHSAPDGTPPPPAELARLRVNVDSLRRLRPPRPDSIMNGADDDGSGSVALLEIAEALAAQNPRPRRSILFVWHTAEEYGLVGSLWFTDHPTLPFDSIVAMIQLDQVGRGSAADILHGGPRFLVVIGSRRRSTELGDVLDAVNAAQPTPLALEYAYDAPGHPANAWCRSDHYSYARYGIPSVFFSTGLHPDYHQVTDEPQYVDYEHMARVTALVKDLTQRLAGLDHRPVADHPVPDRALGCRQ